MVRSYKKSSFKIAIKLRTIPEWLTILIFVLPFCFATFIEIFGISDSVRFVIDLFLVYFCINLIYIQSFGIKQRIKLLTILVITFLIYTLVNYVYNFQSPFFYIWGFRNLFRFYIAFFAYIVYFDRRQTAKFLNLLDIIFWVNFAVSMIQFVFLDINQDNLGGVFGTNRGANGYTLIFLCIVIAKSLLKTFVGKEQVVSCILKCTASVLIAAMAEIKFFFFVFLIILIAASLLTRLTWRKLLLIVLCMFGLILGAFFLSYLFESDSFFSLDYLMEYVQKGNYASSDDLGRGSALSTIREAVFSSNTENILGLGLGNCDISDVQLFSTPFSQVYGHLHYSWFTAPMVFLETGYIGLILYLSFFVLCFVLAYKKLKHTDSNILFCQLGIIMSAICVIIAFYNSSLRTEAGYMAYFILALPFIESKEGTTSPHDI